MSAPSSDGERVLVFEVDMTDFGRGETDAKAPGRRAARDALRDAFDEMQNRPGLEGIAADTEREQDASIAARLASDDALHVTGQVFRAVRDEIVHHRRWPLGPGIEAGRKPRRREATVIGDAVDTHFFGRRVGDLQLG